MRGKRIKRCIAFMLIAMMSMAHLSSVMVQAADISGLASESRLPIVLTLGADLSEEQKSQILQFFGIELSEVTSITVTNADEKEKLGNLISEEKIGSYTYSCALVNPTNAGGIQVKTANMNYVTSNMIAGQLSTSGVYNCEVLTAAPFEVSGTGALTGVMMAYEEASGIQLEEGKKELANVELVTTGSIADTVGQDQATLVVNDIKIHIVRDQITEEQDVYEVVDNVIGVTETAAAEAAANQGKEAPAKLGEVEKTQLYDFSYKFSQMDYDYAQMQPTLERVTYNVATSSGIDDPITDTFTTITEEQVLPSNSILLRTNDKIWGDDAIINATSSVAVADRPAEPIQVFTGEASLTAAGGVKADAFISGTNIIEYKDLNGSYALMDLNGNLLTESIYSQDMMGRKGYIIAELNDGSGKSGILAPDGSVVVDFQYDAVKVVGNMWAVGVILTEGGTEDEYDYTDYTNYYLIDHADVYYIGNQGTQCVGTLGRDDFYDAESCADYINIQARSGVITTYDSAFNAVQTADSLYHFGDYDYDNSLEDALQQKTGYSVRSFYGKYAMVSGDNGYGIIDRYGNVIVPTQFGNFDTSFDVYENGGYFLSIGNEQTVFVTAGGNVTGSFNYGYNNAESVMGYGMSARVKTSDGKYLLLSADGRESDLGTTYEYMDVIKESKGMLWIGQPTNGNGYDLIDWHGNVLLTGSSGYSMSENGSYLISQEGYTSSTLYMVNDADPVDLANSAGGATEMQVETKEGTSLEVFDGEVTIASVGNVASERFIDGTDLLLATNDGNKYAVMDVTDTQYSNPQFSRYTSYESGFVLMEDADTEKTGVMTTKAQMVVPCEFDNVNILNEKWIAAYLLKEATESDYDFQSYSDNGYYQIETAVIYHIGETETASVKLTRDQVADLQADGDYLNVQDRSSGKVTTYDASFNAVAAADSVWNFGDYSYENVVLKQISDKSGHGALKVYDDGYVMGSDWDSEAGESVYGVINMNGEEILPFEYDRIHYNYGGSGRCLSTNGYFCVEKDGKIGFVTKGGEVSCELKYDSENFECDGLAGTYKNGDGTYTIIAADGTESGPYPNSPHGRANGMIFEVSAIDGNPILVDWHGNELLKGYSYFSFSDSGNYFVAKKNYSDPTELFTINGAEVIGVNGNAGGTGAVSMPEAEEPEVQQTEAPAEAETEAPQEMEQIPETQAETAAAEVTETEAPTATGGSKEEILPLLQSASALAEADAAANKAAILTLLTQAKEKAEGSYPDAASVIGGAITLLDTDSPDGASVLALLNSATTILG